MTEGAQLPDALASGTEAAPWDGETLIEITDLTKSFGAVQAVRGVSLRIRRGEVIGLIGANGAGKSTLVRVLAGATRPDSGRVVLEGREVSFRSPRDALHAGIAIDPQELNLVEHQSVADNLFLGDMPAHTGVVRERQLDRRAEDLLAEVGLDGVIEPRRLAGSLTPVQARLVSVAQTLSKDPRLVILDEPSAALPTETAERLGPIIRKLAERGSSVIYVSHRLSEIRDYCDRVIAMRDGAVTGELSGEDMTIDRMVELVGGKALAQEPPPSDHAVLETDVVVRAHGLVGNRVRGVDLEIHAGEMIGVGGLYGSGRSELLRLLGGQQQPAAGTLEAFGKRGPRSPHEAARMGIGYLAEGRRQMLFPALSVAANATVSVLSQLHPIFVRHGRERRLVSGIGEKLHLVGRPESPVENLSGGNQQKVCLARWLLREANLLLLDEPTVGIDVHARAEIHQLLRRLAADEGKTIVVASAEPEELVLVCDRVFVMVEGRIARELHAPFDADSVVAASYAAAA